MRNTNKRIAKDWRSRAVTNLKWQKCLNQAGCILGEAGGYFVEADGFERRAYLKPVNPHNNAVQFARAAREKIAADLAFDLGLPVPPCQLYELDSVPTGCEKAVVVSLVMYPTQHSWGVVKTLQTDNSPYGLALSTALSECSPMLVLDTWLNQTDHGDHPHNIVWGYSNTGQKESDIVTAVRSRILQ